MAAQSPDEIDLIFYWAEYNPERIPAHNTSATPGCAGRSRMRVLFGAPVDGAKGLPMVKGPICI